MHCEAFVMVCSQRPLQEEDSNPEFNGGNPAGTQDKKRVRPSMKTIENFLQIRALEISML